MAKRTNKWTFANLGDNVSKQVWLIGQDYKNRFRDPKRKPRHINEYPVQLLKYFYFLYLTGSRLMEPLCEPAPTIAIINREGKVWVEIAKVNEKHKGPDGGRDIIDQALPVFNEWEQNMWNFITDGGISTNARDIFQLEKWPSVSEQNINCLLKTNFKTNLRDEGGHLHENYGITPHMLRHMRAFNVVVNYGVEVPLAITWFGWKDQRMLYYYAHLRKALKINSQVEMLKRGNLLTNLNIDMAKAITGY